VRGLSSLATIMGSVDFTKFIRSLADFNGAPWAVWSLAETATVTVQGFMLRLDTTSKGWGLLLGHQRGLSPGHQGLFLGPGGQVFDLGGLRLMPYGQRWWAGLRLMKGWDEASRKGCS
jgi:hypothetical protein